MSVLNRSRRLAIAAAAIVTTAGLALTGCSSSGTAASSDSASTLVAYTGQSGDYQINFNPWSPSNIGGIGTIYESLFFITNVNTADPKPLLGKSYEWNADGTQLTIELRDGVQWSDGEPFTAKDVVFTLDMLKQDKSLNSIGYTGTAKAEGDAKVVVSFDEPSFVLGPNLLGKTWIVPEHLWKGIDPATDVMREPVGTGPYTLGNFKAQAFTLTANKDYWGGAPAVKTVRYLSLSGNTPVPTRSSRARSTGRPAPCRTWTTSRATTGLRRHHDRAEPDGPDHLREHRPRVLRTADRPRRPARRRRRDQPQAAQLAGVREHRERHLADVRPHHHAEGHDLEGRVAGRDAELARHRRGRLDARGRRVEEGLGRHLRQGRAEAVVDRRGRHRLDRLHHRHRHDDPAAQGRGIELKAQQSSWNEWTDKKTKGQFQLAIDSLGQGPTANPYYLYNNNLATSNTAKVGEAAATNLSRYSNPDVDAALAKLKAINPEDKAATQPELDTIQQHLVEDMPYIPILTGGTTSEVHTAKFTGWPTQDDLYAFPAIWASPDNAEVFKALKPVKG